MLITFWGLFQAALVASSCSIDAFSVSFAYGSNKIKVPMASAQLINLICSSVLGLSLWAGTLARQYLPGWLTVVFCFGILFSIGMAKLLDGIVKSLIRKFNGLHKEVKFSLSGLRFILNLYADPEEADVDGSRVISTAEAAMLALSLSLDGLAIGIGASLGNINPLAIFIASLITGLAAVLCGCYLGNKIAHKLPFNISWLSGVILIALAFIKLF